MRYLLSEKPTGKYRFYINSIKAEADTGNGDDKVSLLTLAPTPLLKETFVSYFLVCFKAFL